MSHVWVLFLVFYLFRAIVPSSHRARRVYRDAQQFLPDFAARDGGSAFLVGRRKIVYRPRGSKAEVEIDCSRAARLNLRLPGSFPYSAAFYRVPRLIYAFLESFISAGLRFDGLPYLVVSSSADSVAGLKEKTGFLSLITELSKYGLSVRFKDAEIVFRKRLRSRELNDRDFRAMIRLAEDFTQLCSKALIHIPVQPVESENRCAYCKEPMHDDASIIYCSVCGTPHHAECFQLNGKCSVFGCDSSRPVQTPLTIAN
jgi:hypothetical protein